MCTSRCHRKFKEGGFFFFAVHMYVAISNISRKRVCREWCPDEQIVSTLGVVCVFEFTDICSVTVVSSLVGKGRTGTS